MHNTLKETLEKKQQELSTRLESVRKDLHQGHSADFAEQATERENEDVLRGIESETEHELKQIAIALQRIADGNYGACVECGQPIGEQRLAALPEANTCIECAS